MLFRSWARSLIIASFKRSFGTDRELLRQLRRTVGVSSGGNLLTPCSALAKGQWPPLHAFRATFYRERTASCPALRSAIIRKVRMTMARPQMMLGQTGQGAELGPPDATITLASRRFLSVSDRC